MSDPTNIDNDGAFAESLSDTLLEDRIKAHDKTLRWQPRDRSGTVRRWEARLQRAEGKRTGLEARHAEAVHKAHRYRYLPWLGKSWSAKLELAKADLEAAKAEAKWARYKLERARLACRKREIWRQTFGPEIAERRALRQERDRRQAGLGTKRLDEMRDRGAKVAAEGSSEARRWAEAAGAREWRAQLREQREAQQREWKERGH